MGNREEAMIDRKTSRKDRKTREIERERSGECKNCSITFWEE